MLHVQRRPPPVSVQKANDKVFRAAGGVGPVARALPEADEGDDLLAGHLSALGHPARIELLRQLRIPRTVREIQIRPRRSDEAGSADRPMSRNAVERHLGVLTAIGVVKRRDGDRDGRQVHEYVLQHQRLFQVVEALRDVTALRPVETMDLDRTVADAKAAPARAVDGPAFRILNGPSEGRAVRLVGDGPWTIGRSSRHAIVLDHDPYVSSDHAFVAMKEGRFIVQDDGANRNGTRLNWQPLPPRTPIPLTAGDVVGVGRSLMLFRDADRR